MARSPDRDRTAAHRLAWWASGPDGADGHAGWSAGHLRLVVPTDGVVHLEVGLVASDGSSVLVTDHAVPLPTGGGLEVRTYGLWAEVVVEEAPEPGRAHPVGHLGVGLEAFGVALVDPDEAWRGGPDHQFRGDRLPVGLDLGVEAVADPVEAPWGLGVPCRVDGEVLVADRVLEVDGWAWWLVGEPSPGTRLVTARTDDGTWLLETGDAGDTWRMPDPAGRAPVLWQVEGREFRVDRRFGPVAGPGGRSGTGWIQQPA